MHVFLFPSSQYLREKWWHRFASVVLWAWVAATIFFTLKWFVFDLYYNCTDSKTAAQLSDLACGSGPFDFLASIFVNDAAGAGRFYFFILIAMAISLLLPGILYRVILYIAKGRSWKDHGNAA